MKTLPESSKMQPCIFYIELFYNELIYCGYSRKMLNDKFYEFYIKHDCDGEIALPEFSKFLESKYAPIMNIKNNNANEGMIRNYVRNNDLLKTINASTEEGLQFKINIFKKKIKQLK